MVGSEDMSPEKYGGSAAGGGDPPASNSKTLNLSDNLPATTHPAVPPPTNKQKLEN